MVLPIVVPPATTPPTLDLPQAPAAAHSEEKAGRTHTVRAGETLSGIAERYGTTVAALRSRNHVNGFIHPGQKLKIPGAARSAGAKKKPARTTKTRSYTVRSGDTLSGIATRHRMSPARLASLNGISTGSFIHPGQKLRVNGSAAKPAKRPVSRTSGARHTVRAGETLSGIADRYRMSLARLAKINGVSSSSFIHPGQKLKVSGTAKKAVAKKRSTAKKKPAFSHNTFAGRTYPSSIVNAASRNRATLAKRSVPSRDQVRRKIVATAKRHGVDPKLALAISYQESGWDHRQVSVANAIGTMQVIPSSGEWASTLVGRKLNLLDADDNITAGVVLLGQLTRMASSDSQAIAGYYQGLGSVRANGMYSDTRQYVANVKHHRARM